MTTHARHTRTPAVEAMLWAAWVTARFTGVGLLAGAFPGALGTFAGHTRRLVGRTLAAVHVPAHVPAAYAFALTPRRVLAVSTVSALLGNLVWLALR